MATTPYYAPVRGRFRLANIEHGLPVALDTWRLTTDDWEVAEAVHAALGGEKPRTWLATSKDDIEVLTATSDLAITITSGAAFKQRIRRKSDPDYESNGRTLILPDGSRIPDPEKHLTIADRRRRARQTGEEELVTSLFFQLAGHEQLGTFLFRSASWQLGERFANSGLRSALDNAGRGIPATLRLAHGDLQHTTAQLLLTY